MDDAENQKISVQIMEALKPILPKGMAFIIVMGQTDGTDLNVTCNIPDDMAIDFLEAAIEAVSEEPAINLEERPTKETLN